MYNEFLDRLNYKKNPIDTINKALDYFFNVLGCSCLIAVCVKWSMGLIFGM